MRVLVTGGAGFIGSHIVEDLLARGLEVAVLDNLATGKRENVPKGVPFFQVDLRDKEEVERAFREFRPTHVSHQAAQASVKVSVEDPVLDFEVNLLGGLNLLEACRQYGVEKLVFASTGGAIYGEVPEGERAEETWPPRPKSPYAASKAAFEHYLSVYGQSYGLKWVSLRYGNVYGPRQDPHGEAGVVAIFCGRLAAGERATINGTGEQTRDYVYVGDVARANVLALENELPPGAYNIGTGVETSVNELYERLRRLSGRDDLDPEHGPAKPGEQQRSCVDPSLAGRVMGWRPEVGLDAGLKETLRFFGAL